MEVRHYLDILRRRIFPIAIVTALAVTVAVIAGLVITPVYTASATVRVIQEVGVQDLRIGDTYGERLMNTYGRILTSWPALERAAQSLGSSLPGEVLWQKVKVEVVPDTELMKISAQDQDPRIARDLANILAGQLVEHAHSLYTGSSKSARQIVEEQLASLENDIDSDRQQLELLLSSGKVGTEVEALRSQIEFEEDAYNHLLNRYELARLNESLRANTISIVAPARLPQVPSNSLALKEVGLSLIAGLFGGISLALVLENLDTRIHSSYQLEHLTQLPVLGTVPKGLLALDGLGRTNGAGSIKPVEDAYRLLSINLQILKEDVPLQTLLITSAVSKEGKSTVAANLAQTLAERGQTVFLVGSDLRRPTVEKIFGLDNSLGLSNLLAERVPFSEKTLSSVTHPVEQPSLFIIGSGPKPANPTALLAAPPIVELLDYLGAQGQITLLDAPPVLGMADVSVLARKVDGIILVVRKAYSRREQVLAALKQLQASRACVVGFIFLQESDKDWGYE